MASCQRREIKRETRNFRLAGAILYSVAKTRSVASTNRNRMWFGEEVVVDLASYLGG